MSRLEDVQRELDAVKAERRRRQQALYDLHRPVSKASSPPFSSPSGRFPTTTAHAVMCTSRLAHGEEGDGSLSPPYRPETSIPRQLLSMAYVPRPDGLLSPCPSHFMGKHVESLDLSPWDFCSSQATDSLWQLNRRVCPSVVARLWHGKPYTPPST